MHQRHARHSLDTLSDIPDIPVKEVAMGMELMARYSLPASDRSVVGQGADLLKRRTPADRVEMLLVHPDGSQEAIEVSAAVTGIIADLLEKASASEEVALLIGDAEISPEDAATILGISRPLVRRRMDVGDLPFRRVGAHRRVRLSDVLALKRREAPIRTALEELRADTEDLMTHGL
jgi:excisionase family DNA binding protein